MFGRLDKFQENDELEPSWSTMLDTVGMQPHAREFLEREMTGIRSDGYFECMTGQTIDHMPGIHFGDTP
jgi:hypothetical protein